MKKSIKALDDNLKVTEIRIVVEGGSLDNVRDKESLETGVAMTQGNTRTIHVTEAIGKGVTYDLIGWRKRSIPTHSEWLYPLTFDAGKGLKEA